MSGERRRDNPLSDSIEISSGIDLGFVIDKIVKSADNTIDYFVIEEVPGKNSRYIFNIISKKRLPKEHIAELLSEWILRCYEPRVMAEILHSDFVENDYDKQQIIKAVTAKIDFIRYFYNKGYIVKKITNYLKSEKAIQIEGFVRFRLSEYRQELSEMLYAAAEEYYIEKEYEEFITLLSEYVDECPPMIDLLHVSRKPDGEFLFYDFTKTKIRIDAEKTTAHNPIENFLTYEDILVSILITLAPKRIIWHSSGKFDNQNITKTIKAIFKDRFSVCCGCELCDKD